MDRLKMAFNLVARKAKEQRSNGSVPTVLGVRGLLALMYDRIVKFSESESDHSEYVLDLAVKAMFAMAECLPSLNDDDIQEQNSPTDNQEKLPELEWENTENDYEESVDSSQYTAIPPGKNLRDMYDSNRHTNTEEV
jgi:hypothetical protein